MSTQIPPNQASFTAEEIAQITQGKTNHSIVIKGISTDTRLIQKGSLFVALRGDHFDGHRFVEEAVRLGAAAVLVEHEATVSSEIPTIRVKDTLVALGLLANAHRNRWGGKVVAITGSAGKTTTKELTAAAIAATGKNVLATVGNLNNRIGVPLTLLSLNTSHEIAVIEMGTSERGEIAELTRISQPDIAVLTLIALAHSATIGGIKEIAEEKASIFSGLKEDGIAVANFDDINVLEKVNLIDNKVIGYGYSDQASVQVTQVTLNESRTSIQLKINDKTFYSELHLVGQTAALNVACAMAVVKALKLDLDSAIRGLTTIQPSAGRMSVKHISKNILVIDDTYNANPSSMTAAVQAGANFAREKKGRLIVVLGDMLELGEYSESAHAKLGQLIGELGTDIFIACGDHMKFATAEARRFHVSIAEVKDSTTAAKVAYDLMQPADVIVVKGSRSMHMEQVVNLIVGGAQS